MFQSVHTLRKRLLFAAAIAVIGTPAMSQQAPTVAATPDATLEEVIVTDTPRRRAASTGVNSAAARRLEMTSAMSPRGTLIFIGPIDTSKLLSSICRSTTATRPSDFSRTVSPAAT